MTQAQAPPADRASPVTTVRPLRSLARRKILQIEPRHGIEMTERFVHQKDGSACPRRGSGQAPRAGACRPDSRLRAGRPDRVAEADFREQRFARAVRQHGERRRGRPAVDGRAGHCRAPTAKATAGRVGPCRQPARRARCRAGAPRAMAQKGGLADAAAPQQAGRAPARETRATTRSLTTTMAVEDDVRRLARRGQEKTPRKPPVPTPALTGSGSRGRPSGPLSRAARLPPMIGPHYGKRPDVTQVS